MDASTSTPNQTSVSQQRQLQAMDLQLPTSNQAVDMFTERGFALAVRLAKAYSSSDAVPACFRQTIEKKGRGGSTWLDNPAALGNCLVAIETARAVGVSITSVMQNANVIEGRLTWSAQYKIAAINASGRFTPLRFELKNLGRIKATYKEKLGWNDQKRGFDFREVQVEVDNWQCIAWALPHGMQVPAFNPDQLRQHTLLELVRAAGMPVIESAPVSMKMAVEEGWYGKSGSKWQTELKQLMLQYRAGSFFGNIHAPDIVMGMGRTTEEIVDISDAIDVTPTHADVSVPSSKPAAGEAQVVGQVNTNEHDEHPPEEQGGEQQDQQQDAPVYTFAQVADKIAKATTVDAVNEARDLIRSVKEDQQRKELAELATAREKELSKPASTPAPTKRRAAAANAG
jgi:hypothetical protein